MPREAAIIYVKRGFRGSRLPELLRGEYSAALDKQCAGFSQADRAGDCREFSFS